MITVFTLYAIYQTIMSNDDLRTKLLERKR